MKRAIKKLPMALVSALLVMYVIWTTDWSLVLGKVTGVSPFWVAMLALSAPALVAVSVWKWQRLLAVRGVDVGFKPLFGMYVAGQFYNNLLPTSSGGDVVRAEMLRRKCRDGHLAYGSIVAERFTGLAVLIVLAVVSLVEAPALWPHTELVVGVGLGLTFALTVMVVVISRRITRLLDRWLGHIGPAKKALTKVHDFQDSLWEYRQYPRELVVALVLSVLFYVLCIVGTTIAAEAVGRHEGLWAVSVCVPMVLIITLLPISLNGAGLWEAAFGQTFEAMGMSWELGVLVALLLRLRDVAWSVIGYAVLCALGVAAAGVGRGTHVAGNADAAGADASAVENTPAPTPRGA